MLAWLMTLIFSWPQAVIFRVMKHPNKEFYQCTTFNFFENLALGIGNDSFYRKLKQVIEELSYKIYAGCRWTNPHSMGWCLPHRLQLCSVFWASNCHSNKLHSVYNSFFDHELNLFCLKTKWPWYHLISEFISAWKIAMKQVLWRPWNFVVQRRRIWIREKRGVWWKLWRCPLFIVLYSSYPGLLTPLWQHGKFFFGWRQTSLYFKLDK